MLIKSDSILDVNTSSLLKVATNAVTTQKLLAQQVPYFVPCHLPPRGAAHAADRKSTLPARSAARSKAPILRSVGQDSPLRIDTTVVPERGAR